MKGYHPRPRALNQAFIQQIAEPSTEKYRRGKRTSWAEELIDADAKREQQDKCRVR